MTPVGFLRFISLKSDLVILPSRFRSKARAAAESALFLAAGFLAFVFPAFFGMT